MMVTANEIGPTRETVLALLITTPQTQEFTVRHPLRTTSRALLLISFLLNFTYLFSSTQFNLTIMYVIR